MQDEALNNQTLVSNLVKELIKEKRSDRRWRNIRFFIGFFLIVGILLLAFSQTTQPAISDGEGTDYISLVRLNGMIGPGEDFSSEVVVPLLQSAFEDTGSKGVILNINSGGGTPVQASIIHDKIIELKKKYHKKVIVVAEDMLASGAYFVSVAADKIYVNPSSIAGSIGVVMKGFGLVGLIDKIGVERRVYTSGTEKDRLDPFLPQNADDVEKIRQVMGEVHANFKQVVIEGRKGKLQADEATLFNGDFWSGVSALKLGLVDGLGNLSEVMQKEFKVNRYKDYSQSGSVIKTLMGQVSSSLNLMTNTSPQVMTTVAGYSNIVTP